MVTDLPSVPAARAHVARNAGTRLRRSPLAAAARVVSSNDTASFLVHDETRNTSA